MAQHLNFPTPARADAEFYKREHAKAHQHFMHALQVGHHGMMQQCQERRTVALHRMVEAQRSARQ